MTNNDFLKRFYGSIALGGAFATAVGAIVGTISYRLTMNPDPDPDEWFPNLGQFLLSAAFGLVVALIAYAAVTPWIARRLIGSSLQPGIVGRIIATPFLVVGILFVELIITNVIPGIYEIPFAGWFLSPFSPFGLMLAFVGAVGAVSPRVRQTITIG